jgi:hypothetical protein
VVPGQSAQPGKNPFDVGSFPQRGGARQDWSSTAGRIDLRSLVATEPIVAEIIFAGESPDIVTVRE